MAYEPESVEIINRLNRTAAATVATESQRFGLLHSEPLYVAMDGMIRYAKAYRKAYGSAIGTDGILGAEWLSVVKGLRGLLDGQGVAAMEQGRTTDSKDNGTIEAMYWKACEIAEMDGDK